MEYHVITRSIATRQSTSAHWVELRFARNDKNAASGEELTRKKINANYSATQIRIFLHLQRQSYPEQQAYYFYQ